MPVLELVGVTRMFGPAAALSSVSFSLSRGEILGLVGHNGAGKTTAFRIAAGLVRPTSGQVRVFGSHPGKEAASRTGVLIDSSFPPYLTPVDCLVHACWLRRIPTAEVWSLIRTLGLGRHARVPAGKLSYGLRQRLGLCHALVGEPELLLLDEPLVGLDPHVLRSVRDLLRALARNGTAIMFSSHQLHEVESLCDRVVVLDRGSVTCCLRSGAGAPRVVLTVSAPAGFAPDLPAGSVIMERGTGTWQIAVPSGRPLHEAIVGVIDADGTIVDLERRAGSLESAVLDRGGEGP